MATAADILRNAMSSGFDPVKLAALRASQADELRDRLANDDAAAVIPKSGFVPGQPGATFSTNEDAVSNAIGDRRRLRDVESDSADDPFTGKTEQDRVARTTDALDEAALTNRTEIGDAAKTVAKRNAFATFLNDLAPFKAEDSPAGATALDARSRRKVAENTALVDAKGAAKPLSAEGTKSIDALHQAFNLGSKLYTMLQKRGADPAATRAGGVLDQVGDVATARAKRWMYGQGILQAPDGYDEATQLADWMKVLASRGLMGSMRNMEWVSQIQDHLANGRLPDPATLQRLKMFMEQAPSLERDIYDVEKGHKLLPEPGAPGNPLGAAGAPAPTLPGEAPKPATGSAYDRYLASRGGR